jgi:hypothetical protein
VDGKQLYQTENKRVVEKAPVFLNKRSVLCNSKDNIVPFVKTKKKRE